MRMLRIEKEKYFKDQMNSFENSFTKMIEEPTIQKNIERLEILESEVRPTPEKINRNKAT